MPRTPARFTQADIQRAIRALKAEEFFGSVEILSDGRIRIAPIDVSELPSPANSPTKPRILL